MQAILNLFTAIRALINLIKYVQEWQRQQAKEKREAALKDSQNAKTDDEIWDSQDRIVNNRPR